MGIINSILNHLQNRTGRIQYAVNYAAPNWIIMVRNPNARHWEALRSTTQFIVTHDEFGKEIARRPAVQVFQSATAANMWVDQNAPEATRMKQPAPPQKQGFSSLVFGGMERK